MQRRIALISLAALAGGGAQAQEPVYPAKTIRIIVTAQPGGAGDFIARMVGDRLSKAWGQPVVVENKAGANGALGLTEIAKAAPDGYTIGVTIGDSLINNVVMVKNLGYDPRRDFAYITQFARAPILMSANPSLGIKSVDDMRKLAAQKNVKLSYGTWGPGGLGHLAGETLNRQFGGNMVHVPQRGEAPVMQDLLTNTVSVGLTSVGLARQHVAAGKVVPLAIMGMERSPLLPNIPTMKELGFDSPLYNAAVWLPFVAPAKTPPAIIQKLANEIRAIGSLPDVRASLAEKALEPMLTTPDEFAANHRRDFDVIVRTLRDFGIQGE